MNRSRLEAFSDGVIAIIITIMVLELKVPHSTSWNDLLALWPVLLSYLLSFVNIGIFWVNHHHMLHTVKKVNGAVLWANLNLLFWLSLMPFATAWMGENHFSDTTVVLYCAVLCLCALAHTLLHVSIVRHEGQESILLSAVGSDLKRKLSLAGHVLATLFALAGLPLVAGIILAAIALAWLVPDKRIEHTLLKNIST
jgi:uncharacterized membrane protein